MNPSFIHLNVHTEYSLFDGLASVQQLAEACKEQGMFAVGVTDQMNLFGLVKFYQACLGAGVKPIVGAGIYIENPKDERQPFQAILLCQNALGYRHLSELISDAYLHGQHLGKAIVKREQIASKAEGLIMLSGAQAGDVGRALLAGDFLQAEKQVQDWQAIFPQRYYLELQRVGQANEEEYIHSALKLAKKLMVPVVATNAVRFLKADDFEAHEARVAIHEGYVLTDPKRPQHYTRQQYLRSPAEMEALFATIPAALQNS
ncbi:MAG: polymerase alpha subunit, partial [Gammaproteobacteria bacterium]|nr:polymerase alpha subunit [Gammaproteobacteria bacterium]